MTLSAAQLKLLQLKVFSIYPGKARVVTTTGLNGNSSFIIPATKYSQAYAVNIPSSKAPPSTDYVIGPDYQLKKASGTTQYFDTSLKLTGTENGGLARSTGTSAASNAPTYTKAYAKADAEYADSNTQTEYDIQGINGIGYHVTTDGAGNILSVSLILSEASNVNNIQDAYPYSNRADIVDGAVPKEDNPGALVPSLITQADIDRAKAADTNTTTSVSPVVTPVVATPAPTASPAAVTTPVVTPTPNVTETPAVTNPTTITTPQSTSSVQTVAGSDSTASPSADPQAALTLARQQAVTQADLTASVAANQSTSPDVTTTVQPQTEVTPQAPIPTMDRQMDGRIPAAGGTWYTANPLVNNASAATDTVSIAVSTGEMGTMTQEGTMNERLWGRMNWKNGGQPLPSDNQNMQGNLLNREGGKDTLDLGHTGTNSGNAGSGSQNGGDSTRHKARPREFFKMS